MNLVKPLNEMSLEELGRLFPIILSEYNPDWPAIYSAEKELIEHAVGRHHIKRISHYGSTSIPGIIAKPTIDILLEVSDDCDNEELIRNLVGIGYLYDPQPRDPPPHMMFMKGYTPEGFVGQAYHIHVRYGGDWDELYFRDYLIFHPDVAEEYSKLKRRLKEEYPFDREAYTRGKTAFIRSVVKKARGEPGRIE
ncbi:GrpB family protein [Methanoculleus nereidis]|nr:GrpB family protein [Methanoculleus sp. YWC-01]